MNIRIIFGTILLFSTSFCMAQDRFEISGRLSEVGSEKRILLSYINSAGKKVSDTVSLNNGQFEIAGTTAFGNKASLQLLPLKGDTSKRQMVYDLKEFYLEKGKYTVSGKDRVATASISGAPAQADYLEFDRVFGEPYREYNTLVRPYMLARQNKDSVEVKRLSDLIVPLMARVESALDAFIFSHPDSYVALDVTNQYRTSVIDPSTFDKYYKPFSKRVMASFTGHKLTEKYNKAKQIAIGQQVDFTQKDVNGTEFSISSLKGKYVLVDFWASWCKPCRAENPYLLKAYKELKDKNFEIVSISLDEKRDYWLTAMQQDGMPWIQVSNLEGFKSGIAVKYGITAIPQNFLINPEGVIIAKDLRGEDVNKKIASYIK
jgi:thiol-disulfide isomerase/thioredoxin